MNEQEALDLATFHRSADQAVGDGFGAARTLLEATVGEQGTAEDIRHVKQFMLGSIALDRCILEREMSQAGDWICWSLTSRVVDDQAQELHVGRLYSFPDRAGLMESPFGDLFISWLAHFFYYARIRAAMPEIAKAVFPLAVMVFKMGPVQHRGVADLGAMSMAWANQERADLVAELMPAFEDAASNESLPPAIRIPLILTLTGKTGDASRCGAMHWLNVARGPLFNQLNAMQRLHVLTDAYGRLGTEEMFEDLVVAVDQLQAEALESEGINARRMVDACADYSFAMVGSSLTRGELERALTLLAHWYGVREDRLDTGEVIVFCPMHSDGYIAVSGRQCTLVARNQDAVLRELAYSGNVFLGVANSISGASALPVHTPDRFGVPTAQSAPRFEAALREAYCPNEFTPDLTDNSSQVVLRSQAQPFQAIQLHTWGTTWPVTSSLRRPKPDRPLATVLLWSGGGSMTEAIELEAVQAILEAAGAHVQLEAPEGLARDQFLAEYSSARWDVVWLASHGEFNHWDPKSARVQIDRVQSYTSIDDILDSSPRGAARRLLMLNVCDGARSGEHGLLPRVGLAPAIAGPDQAVISHLWPTENWAAATFGVLLAIELVRTRSFFAAFVAALGQLRAPPREIADRLNAAKVGQEIAARLRHADAGTEINIWGSPAFFQ